MEQTGKRFNFNVEGNVIEIREGKAPDLPMPVRKEYKGLISAPADFYDSKIAAGFKFDLKECIVFVNRTEGTLSFLTDEHMNALGTSVRGSLTMNPDLNKFRINDDYTQTPSQMSRFLKMSRMYFPDKDRNMQIVKDLQNFKLSYQTEVEKGNDFKGNKTAIFERKVKEELNFDFTLAMPIFKGSEPSTFKVEMMFDIRDGGVSMWLESVELKEVIEEKKAEILNAQIERFAGVPMIEV